MLSAGLGESGLIDLHSHLLPGVDDGAATLDVALAMARMAAADGIVTMACTPHFMPGVYVNDGETVRRGLAILEQALHEAGIALQLVGGNDIHAVRGLSAALSSGRVLTLNGSRYLLLEPPHDVLLPRLSDLTFDLLSAGYVPILTHPERLLWIDQHYEVIEGLAHQGVLMQLTAGSLSGVFGRRAKYWAERMLSERIVDVVASDAHDCERRPPILSRARDAIARRVGEDYAYTLVALNPLRVIKDLPPSALERSLPIEELQLASGEP